MKLAFQNKKLIVIALTEHIGDIIAAEPISRQIRQKNPASCIVFIVNKRFAELIESNPNIDKSVQVRSFTEWILLRHFILKRNLYDLHIDGKICQQYGFQLVKKDNAGVTVENYLKEGNLLSAFGRSAGIQLTVDDQPLAYLPEKAPTMIDGKYLVLHTSAGHIDKTINSECWQKIAELITSSTQGYRVVEIGLEKNINLDDNLYIDLTGERRLSEIAALIDGCSLFIGLDSGFAHLANALNKNSLIFIGYFADFKGYMPYSGYFQRPEKDMINHYPGPLRNMSCYEVLEVVKKKLIL
jgi:heptosyltransferase-3